MANEQDPQQDLRWLLEPPAPGAIQLHIAVGEGTELTPEAREAIDNLVRMIQRDDTRGFAAGPRLTMAADCDINCLPLSRCHPEYTCMTKDTCHIIPCPDYRFTVTRTR
jgi:hypothetical protein